MEQTAQLWCIGHHTGQFGHVDVVQAERYVLQCILVGSGIELESCTVVGQQIYQCQHPAFSGQLHIVVLVKREAAVGYDGIERCHVQSRTLWCHIGLYAQIYSLFAFGIDEVQMCRGSCGGEACLEGGSERGNTIAPPVLDA